MCDTEPGACRGSQTTGNGPREVGLAADPHAAVFHSPHFAGRLLPLAGCSAPLTW